MEQVQQALARGLTGKMLHGTMAELHGAEGAERVRLADTVSRLFLRGNSRSHGSGEGHERPEGHEGNPGR